MSTTPNTQFNISAELAALKHEKKNNALHRLPSNYTVQRRPLNHAPVANIHAGAHVPKVVYVSKRTPMMSAVKRVKKMLGLVEKRAMQQAGVRTGGRDRNRRIVQANEQIVKNKEEVLVKASGRAMEQALRVGEWFKNKETEFLCNVEVRPGSVSVVDDIVEVENEDEEEKEEDTTTTTGIEYGDTTLEMVGGVTTSTAEGVQASDETGQKEQAEVDADADDAPGARRKRKKRKRPVYNEEDVPEARLRWIKTVEVAISLQG
ncbi:Rpp20 subunit of nuclear RNase MRP and P-domain-containing protein [Exophiala viscosa]|uniref:Rpp20 subunit of nuclear RNase MRP and P-domain-containing protein n=1 Tax=Exophiala viscosa TaxID=2486360 RepID=UPI002194B32A|nr:Rpp20 subunit of nuclear RNase MRP and P-domain-containing protein [Exophiala viscosa]